jgi:hypothetical protein
VSACKNVLSKSEIAFPSSGLANLGLPIWSVGRASSGKRNKAAQGLQSAAD